MKFIFDMIRNIENIINLWNKEILGDLENCELIKTEQAFSLCRKSDDDDGM